MVKPSSAISFSYTGQYKIQGNVLRLLSSGVLTLSQDAICDVFLVGGGGGGARQRTYSGPSYFYYYGGGGGGAGYTTTKLGVLLAKGTHSVSIGEGGAASTAGGKTSLDNYSALGGNPGYRATNDNDSTAQEGGDGGSGGGAGGYSRSGQNTKAGGAGGTDGKKGGNSAIKVGTASITISGGTGQGTTTRAFGEAGGELFATGGKGGHGNNSNSSTEPKTKTANTGDGGDGGRANASAAPTAGASGIALIRFADGTELKAA